MVERLCLSRKTRLQDRPGLARYAADPDDVFSDVCVTCTSMLVVGVRV
jgi:hypothetical protein